MRRTFWKLMLVASLFGACQQKRDLPRIPKLMRGEHVNPLIVVGNGTAYGRIIERLGSR